MGKRKKKAILLTMLFLILLAANGNAAYAGELDDLVVICEEIE